MRIQIPWGLIAIFVSLSLFYYINRRSTIRRQERRDRLDEKRKEYIDVLLKTKKPTEKDDQES